MYVLDTNTLIYFFKDMGNVSRNLLSVPPQEIGIPAIVLYELEVGIKKSTHPNKRIEQLTSLLSIVNLIEFGEKEAKVASQIRVDLEKIGEPIGPYDILIAATALANQAPLVTHNQKEFSRISQLSLVDWF